MDFQFLKVLFYLFTFNDDFKKQMCQTTENTNFTSLMKVLLRKQTFNSEIARTKLNFLIIDAENLEFFEHFYKNFMKGLHIYQNISFIFPFSKVLMLSKISVKP